MKLIIPFLLLSLYGSGQQKEIILIGYDSIYRIALAKMMHVNDRGYLILDSAARSKIRIAQQAETGFANTSYHTVKLLTSSTITERIPHLNIHCRLLTGMNQHPFTTLYPVGYW